MGKGRRLKVLVTGASGFLGGHVIEILLGEGCRVVGMVRKTRDTSLLDRLGVEKRVANLTDPPSLRGAVSGADAVVHLGAYYTFHGKKELYDAVNVCGTKSILEACVEERVRRFIYCSTTEAVGPVREIPAREDHPPNPQYEYGRSKLKAERVVKEYQDRINCTIIRPSGIHGPRNLDDIAYYFITACAKNSLATKMLVDSGANMMQFVHAKDAAQGFHLALENENSFGQTYFIAEDKWYPYSEAYEIMSRLTDRKPPTLSVPKHIAKALLYPVHTAKLAMGTWDFMWDPKTVDAVTSDRAYSNEKARKELGYRPKYSLEEGLRETVQWYRENGLLR
jgi:nucleoside-diphosphate-sugar epimerase